jgi:hypothetical protein
MPHIISIPTPCHEDWNEMTAIEQGRHCHVCSKTVMDFTSWQPQQILSYFEHNTNVCGRLTIDQLDEPIPTKEDFVKQISYFSIPFLKKVAAIFLFVFAILGSSFKAVAQGAPIVVQHTDTSKNSNAKVGEVSAADKEKCRIPLKVTDKSLFIRKGKVSIVKKKTT